MEVVLWDLTGGSVKGEKRGNTATLVVLVNGTFRAQLVWREFRWSQTSVLEINISVPLGHRMGRR